MDWSRGFVCRLYITANASQCESNNLLPLRHVSKCISTDITNIKWDILILLPEIKYTNQLAHKNGFLGFSTKEKNRKIFQKSFVHFSPEAAVMAFHSASFASFSHLDGKLPKKAKRDCTLYCAWLLKKNLQSWKESNMEIKISNCKWHMHEKAFCYAGL